MAFLQLFPVFLSLLMIAAHFMRSGHFIVVLFVLFLPFGFLIRKPFIARMIQVVLILGAFEWMRTAFVLASLRIQNDMPWTRLVVILGMVALFTLASSAVFFSKTLKKRFGLR